MLRIMQSFKGKSASDKEIGDMNDFLRDVLVEVVAENYRQAMYEAMALTSDSMRGLYVDHESAETDRFQYDLDPPLRANERVMSGLFATAISRVALRSRTEVRIDKPERDANIYALEHDLEGDGMSTTKYGRVDHLAWCGNRVIGIELKMAGMNCEVPKVTGSISNKWNIVVDQAKTVQNSLRGWQKEDRNRYPNPISMALMVIVGRRSISLKKFDEVNKDIEAMTKAVLSALNSLEPRPTFIADYTFPTEFRALVPRKKGKAAPKDGRAIYTPFVWFIARPAVNANGVLRSNKSRLNNESVLKES